jgi:hypothetical protein
MFAGGTAAPLALTQCRVTLNQERTKTLKYTHLNLNPEPNMFLQGGVAGGPLRRSAPFFVHSPCTTGGFTPSAFQFVFSTCLDRLPRRHSGCHAIDDHCD